MKTLSKSICITFIAIVMMGCNSSDELECSKCDTSPVVAKSDLQYLGWTVPFSIQVMQQDPPIYTLGLSPHARIFSFDENVLNQALYDITPDGRKINEQLGSKFIELLRESVQSDIPVRVYILPETTEIWWVEQATEEDIQKYEAVKQQE